MRTPPAGVVAWNEHEAPWVVDGGYVDAPPSPLTRATLDRGRERFETHLRDVCHGVTGDGDSVVATKMELRKPRSLQEAAVRAYPAGRIYEVVARGYGLMPAYAGRSSPSGGIAGPSPPTCRRCR